MPSKLNPKQEEVAQSIEGIYVVDAGAGTGKTTTITERYHRILEKAAPDRVLLLTFTNNAAEHMRDEIINECAGNYSAKDLMNAPISTFHSFCNRLLKRYGFDVPEHLGIEGNLHNYGVIENKLYEEHIFRTFFSGFQEKHTQYEDVYKIVEYTVALSLIKRLCCKGIFPTRRGWFGNGAELLNGDFELYKKKFDRLNEPGLGKSGRPTQSEFLKSFKQRFRDNLYIDEPSEADLFIEAQVNPAMAEAAFYDDDRTLLMKFVHDVYFEYIQFCVKTNRINFNFMIMFAFVLLHSNHELRENIAFDYVMVDEFQDTNEIQFMMTLLLMKTNNLCAVGDWKQGIYGFRNATIDNILEFDEKIQLYKDILNKDYRRISFDVKAKHREFDINYRSSQDILDFSKKSLLVRASQDEWVDKSIEEKITPLIAGYELNDRTKIEFMQVKDREEEYDLILAKIQEIVGNNEYMLKRKTDDGYATRTVDYRDIAVLARTRAFGFELQNRGMKYGIPVNYDGGIELFRTQPAILVLAWLRLVLNLNNPAGWVPVLEREGYSFVEAKVIIDQGRYPENLLKFRKELVKQEENLAILTDKILKFYGSTCNYANALIVELERLFGSSLISVSSLVRFVEQNIEQNETHNIDINRSENAVTIQTIHGAKGLEYPVVFIVDVNTRRFPSINTERDVLLYHDLIGLRIKKEYGEKSGYKFIFNKWRTDILTTKLFSDYDEERRLLYVAITRAKQYLIFTANEDYSQFFEGMAKGFEIVEDYPLAVENVELASVGGVEVLEELAIGDYEKQGIVAGVHDLMKYTHPERGKGKAFGNELHDFAHKTALGIDAEWNESEAERVRNFIASLNAKELKPEIECSLPIGNNLVRGKIDLVAFCDDEIKIVDYKSDLTDVNEKEYQKQLSMYYHVLNEIYPEKRVSCVLYYVCIDKTKMIEPLPKEDIERLLILE